MHVLADPSLVLDLAGEVMLWPLGLFWARMRGLVFVPSPPPAFVFYDNATQQFVSPAASPLVSGVAGYSQPAFKPPPQPMAGKFAAPFGTINEWCVRCFAATLFIRLTRVKSRILASPVASRSCWPRAALR